MQRWVCNRVAPSPLRREIAGKATQIPGSMARLGSEADVAGRHLMLIVLFALGACASVPLADPQADQEGKLFDPPARDSGALYVYRTGWMALARKVEVSLAGGAQAELAPNTYFRVEGPPGPIDVSCRIDNDHPAAQQIQIAPGETRFVEVSMRSGWLGPLCAVAEVAPDKGRTAVRGSKRVIPR